MELQVDSLVNRTKHYVANTDSLTLVRCGIVQSFKSHYTSDTIALETAQQLENLKYSCECLKKFVQNKPSIASVYNKKSELSKLRQMISNGWGDRDSYYKLVKEEQHNVHILVENINLIDEYYCAGTENLSTSENYIKALIH